MKNSVGLALGYQLELLNNSLFYKLSKTFACAGFDVIALGVRRIEGTCDSGKTKTSESRVVFGSCRPVRYFEISVRIGYGLGLRNLFGILRYQIVSLFHLLKMARKIEVLYAIDFLMGLPFFVVSVLLRKPFVYHIADRFTDSYKVPKVLQPVFAFLEKLLIINARAVIIPNENRFDDILKKFEDKVAIIYNTPEDISPILEPKHTCENRRQGRLRIAYFGILSEDRFIKQLCEVVRNNNRLELDIGGYGSLDKFVEAAAGSCSRIRFFGSIPYEKVLEIQAQSDLLVAMYDPSIKNNRNSSPNKLYEAMMLGKPIIVAKGMGIDSFVEGNDIGYVVDYNINDFAYLIEQLLSCDLKVLELKGLRSRELYETSYNWKIMSERLISIIHNALSNKN